MSKAKAIKVGNPIPAGYKEMARTRCRTCDSEYLIVHEVHEVLREDPVLAERQAMFIGDYLTGEHVDPKHSHLEAYEPLDEE
jgi:hypothetical protein